MAQRTIHKRLSENFVGIVLTVVSIVQGLAFNDLVTRFPAILDYTIRTLSLSLITHFILSFIIVLRVFQTYVAAALEYDDWLPTFRDVFLIFVVGAFEYLLFATLKVRGFSPPQFYARLLAISIIALIGYLNALMIVWRHRHNYPRYTREKRLQIVNIIGVSIILIVSIVVVGFSLRADVLTTVLGLFVSFTIAFNIYYSLKVSLEVNKPPLSKA